jgi:hypothetical protein
MNPFVKLIAIFVGLLTIAIVQRLFFDSSAAIAIGHSLCCSRSAIS